MNHEIANSDFAVGMAGTFDVENYGDLLFPLIAATALRRRDPRIRVVPFSVNGKSEPAWPFQVRTLAEMSASLSTLSALLIGGGQIVRFDKSYPVPVPANADMAIAYWLIPAVQAALAAKPVIWNAVGAWTASPRARCHDDLLREVFATSYFIGVRDVASLLHLAKLAPEAKIEFLPDTAFGLSRLWPLEQESVEFTDWRNSIGLEGNYIVIQANASVGRYRSTIEAILASMGRISAVILPVCWCHDDRAEQFPKLIGRTFLSREWLAPKLISEIIGRSEFLFASSLHACITALSYGVPGARVPRQSDRKFEMLDEFDGIAHVDKKEAVFRLVNRGRCIDPRVIEYADCLDRYWDRVKDVVLQPPIEHCNLSRAVMLNWVAKRCSHPQRLEEARSLVARVWKLFARNAPIDRGLTVRYLSFFTNLAVFACRWTARLRTPRGRARRA